MKRGTVGANPLGSALLKLQRAKEHLETLQAELHTLERSEAFVLEPEMDAAGRQVHRAAYIAQPPARIALVFSDVVHNLRAALDYAVYKPGTKSGFPIFAVGRSKVRNRPSYATLAIEAGEDLGVVSRLLGHATLATTADVYAHLTPAMVDRAAERMDAILGT